MSVRVCVWMRGHIVTPPFVFCVWHLQVQLHRIGGVDWSHVNGADALMSFNPDPSWDAATMEANIKAHQQNFADKPCTFMARIQLDYEMQR